MHKLAGAVLVLCGCLMPAIKQLKEKQHDLRLTLEAAASLDEMRRLLMRNAPTMVTLMEQEQNFCTGELKDFYCSIRLDRLETVSFREQWQAAAKALFRQDDAGMLWAEVGSVLGQCALEEQCKCLSSISEELKSIEKQGREGFSQQKKLYLTLSACAGALMVIMML